MCRADAMAAPASTAKASPVTTRAMRIRGPIRDIGNITLAIRLILD
jgi:hypothetical protein